MVSKNALFRLAIGILEMGWFCLPLQSVTYPLDWRWSNPTPHGADIADVAYATGGLAVQVGERGQIYTSTDMNLWIPRRSHTERALRSVAFLGGRIVISGESGTILFADDVNAFRRVDLDTPDWLESVAASSTLVVAVGDHAAIYTSTNAVSWQRQSISFTTSLRSVAWGPPGFVTVGENGFVASSLAGANWTLRASGLSQHLNRVSWAGGQFWIVGDGGKVLTSPDGSAWTLQSSGATNALSAAAGSSTSQLVAGETEVRLREGPLWTNPLGNSSVYSPPPWSYYCALWDGDGYWLGGATGMWVGGYKTNATSPTFWREAGGSVRDWLWAVTRAPNFYIAVGARAAVMTSGNGVDWDLNLVPNSVTNAVFLGTGGATNHFFAVGTAGSMIHSTNGVIWQAIEPRPATNDLQGFAVRGDMFLASGSRGAIITSTNGTSWVKRQTPTTSFISSMAAFPDGLVAVGDNGTVLTSRDGSNWTSRSLSTTNWLYRVQHLNGVLLAVGENGVLLTSPDGATWTSQNSGVTAWLTDSTFVDGAWFVVGTGGTVLSSTNLTAWANLGTLTGKSLFGVAADGTQLVTVGVEGIILRSQIVPRRTPISFVNYTRSAGRNVFLFGGQPDQRFTLERSPDLFDWESVRDLEFIDGTGTLLLLDGFAPERPREFFRGRLLP